MAYSKDKLSVKKINTLPAGTHGDGGGLWIRKHPNGKASWIFRYRLHNRPRQMGLGSFPAVSLAAARKERNKWSECVAHGKDPQLEKELQLSEIRSNLVSLSDVAEDAYKARKMDLKEGGKAGRWFSPLKLHVLQKIGHLPVSHITQIHIRDALKPIWHVKIDTSRKAINRLNIVLRHAAALGLDVDLMAVDKAAALLGKQHPSTVHIPSMPWEEVPTFYNLLSEDTLGNLALKLLILNPGPRSKPIRYLKEEHIQGDSWVIPGELMKGTKGRNIDWRTPLSIQSLEVLEKVKPYMRDGYMFPSSRGGGVISDMTMNKVMQRHNLPYRPHGFRASFKTWAAENRKPRDITELCLAHSIFGTVEAAYLRTDFFEDRMSIMNEWSQFVTSSKVLVPSRIPTPSS